MLGHSAVKETKDYSKEIDNIFTLFIKLDRKVDFNECF